MNHLEKFFETNTGNCIDKWQHYFEIYDLWFKKYRNNPVVILEIGIYQGGSLNMWRDYFGKGAEIYAIDINPACKQFETEGTKIFIGSQDDRLFLSRVKEQIPKIDILIDDGGHSMSQQRVTFEELYGHIKSDGIYLCEDLHTSYWKNYGGGYKKSSSFIEFSKNLIDELNAWHARNDKLSIGEFTRSTFGLHFYPSMLVIEKKLMKVPTSKRQGEVIIPTEEFPLPDIKTNFFEKLQETGLRLIKRQKRRFLRIGRIFLK